MFFFAYIFLNSMMSIAYDNKCRFYSDLYMLIQDCQAREKEMSRKGLITVFL